MADNDKKGKKGNDNKNQQNSEQEKTTPLEKVEKAASTWEKIQNVGIVAAFLAGILRPSSSKQASDIEKQVPDWVMSMFPHLTKEDEKEYGRILASLNPLLRNVLTSFEDKLRLESIYDETSFRVMLVQARREHIEGIKNPPPSKKAEDADIVTFSKLKLRDTVEIFTKELRKAEQDQTRTPEEIFEEQKRIALSFKLIEKKSFFKKCSEHKVTTFVGIILFPIGFFQLLFWILN